MATKRLYYDDSFTREFMAKVVECKPAGEGRWAVTLDETLFYPNSGGQPHDTGTLGGAAVLDVLDEEDAVRHVVDRELAPGSDASAEIDWARRFDHMQQHTGQHLLSAILHTRFQLPTVSFHMGELLSTIDVRGNAPSAELLARAEAMANAVIFEDRAVNVRYGTAEELAKLGVRKEVERSGTLRAIEIEGTDLQPCGGTHVARTGQIGVIVARRVTKIRQDWRIEFACGGRAAKIAREDFQIVSAVSETLKASREDLADAAKRAVAERDETFKRLGAVNERLAALEAAEIARSVAPDARGLRVVARILEGSEPAYAGMLATQLAKNEKTVALFGVRETGQLFFAQHASAGLDMSAALKSVTAKCGGKGGGTKEFARGAIGEKEKLDEALREAAQGFASSATP